MLTSDWLMLTFSGHCRSIRTSGTKEAQEQVLNLVNFPYQPRITPQLQDILGRCTDKNGYLDRIWHIEDTAKHYHSGSYHPAYINIYSSLLCFSRIILWHAIVVFSSFRFRRKEILQVSNVQLTERLILIADLIS